MKSEGPPGEHICVSGFLELDSSRMVVWVSPTIHKKLGSYLVGSYL